MFKSSGLLVGAVCKNGHLSLFFLPVWLLVCVYALVCVCV